MGESEDDHHQQTSIQTGRTGLLAKHPPPSTALKPRVSLRQTHARIHTRMHAERERWGVGGYRSSARSAAFSSCKAAPPVKSEEVESSESTNAAVATELLLVLLDATMLVLPPPVLPCGWWVVLPLAPPLPFDRRLPLVATLPSLALLLLECGVGGVDRPELADLGRRPPLN